MKQDKIPFSVAYEAAGLNSELQVKVVRKYYENGKVTLKDIKEIKQEYEEKNIPGQIEMDIPAPDQEEKTEVQAPTFTMIQPEDKQASIIKESVDSVKTEVDGIPGQWYKLSDNIVPFPFVPVLVATNTLNKMSIKVHEGFRLRDDSWVVFGNNKWKAGKDDKKIFAWMRMPEYKEE